MIVGVSQSTRKEYAARMNRVVDHIQRHLSEPLDLERIAAIACFSPFHFHRLCALMGETLQVFVHRLRLERAAQMLVFDGCKGVSEIALECGFSSPGAFRPRFQGRIRGLPANIEKARSVNRIARRGKRRGRIPIIL
jgi:AraC family transcriptional regulator